MRTAEAIAAAVFHLAAWYLPAAQTTNTKVARKMNPETVRELVTIPDGQYFTIGKGRLLALSKQLAPADDDVENGTVEQLLAIGAPRILDLQTMRSMPALVATRSDGMRNWMVDVEQNVTWLVSDLTRGVMKSFTVQPLDKRMETLPRSRSGPKPDEFQAGVVNYGVQRSEIPALFGAKWPPGRYAATMVIYDRPSNTVVFETRPLPEPAVLHLEPSPWVHAIPGPLPQGASGTEIRISPASTADQAAQIRIGVMISIPESELTLGKTADSGGNFPILPLSLVLLKLDSPFPSQFDMAVPAAVANGLVSTRFSVNLRDIPKGQRLSGEYQVYLCVGPRLIGPRPVTLP